MQAFPWEPALRYPTRYICDRWIAPNTLLWGVAAICTIFQSLGETTINALRFDRAAIASGEVWRYVSASFVHGTWPHLAMNMAALSLVIIIFGRPIGNARWATGIAISSLAIGFGIWRWQADVDYYVGFSGVLHGLFILGGLLHSRVNALEGWGFVAIISAKLAWEQWSGVLPGSAEWAGGPVLVEAHLYGALAVLPLGLYWRWRDQSRH